jgi:hypothetical protein
MLSATEARFTQFGCGLCAPPTWLNFDASPAMRLQRLPAIGNLVPSGPLGAIQQMLNMVISFKVYQFPMKV